MTEKFDEEDAKNLYFIIQRRRPNWHWKGIMHSLQQAASRGASLTQVMSAAEKTWNNQKATTPAAILWVEHWTDDTTKRASVSGDRMCTYCDPPRRHPIEKMTKESGSWKCLECHESN